MHRARRRYANRAAARDKKPNKWHRWSDYFAPKKLRTLIAARMDGIVTESAHLEAVRSLMKLYELRAESGLERRVRAAQKYRYLTALIPMLLVGLMLLSACELLEQRKPFLGGGPKLVTRGASSACPGRRYPRRAAAHTLITRSSRRE
jgi:hypothetical protein